ncbi:MAG TPA: glycosyltransferase family 2 protein [Acidimicrobiales bacterium]|nr:glycosyltransferase family 2 protein [Acidimicrobiales bacterium]
MAHRPSVDVAIVTYNAAGDLPACVAALRAQGDAVGRVLVIDNASADGTATVAAGLDGVDVVVNPTNVGYAPAMNQAHAAATAPYLLSLNADAVLQPGYVDALVAALDASPRVGAATGLLVRPGGTVDSTGIELTRAYTARERDGGASPDAVVAGSAPFGVSGAAALWRRAMLDDLGPDPWWDWVFVYWDDVELCWRARAHGWEFAYVPSARAVHRRGVATGEPTFTESQSLRNRLGTVARHRGWPGLLAPASLAHTAFTVTRLAVRHPAALRRAHPAQAVRTGLAARRADRAPQ